MNRLDKLFDKKDKDILSVYFTAGFPTLDSTKEIITQLVSQGVDMIEVGLPFSDPMADGPTIQQSSTAALRNGMTLSLLLEQVKEARNEAGDTPLVLMGYLNPMIQYGIERLMNRCKEVGIDALIIPDLPFDEYLRDFKPMCDALDLPLIMLITPETEPERIHLIDDHCSGFIYMVSAAATTGTRDKFGEEQLSYFRRVASMDLKHPRLIGFGISNPQTMKQACDNAAGAIIGSLFIKCLEKEPNIKEAVAKLIEAIK